MQAGAPRPRTEDDLYDLGVLDGARSAAGLASPSRHKTERTASYRRGHRSGFDCTRAYGAAVLSAFRGVGAPASACCWAPAPRGGEARFVIQIEVTETGGKRELRREIPMHVLEGAPRGVAVALAEQSLLLRRSWDEVIQQGGPPSLPAT